MAGIRFSLARGTPNWELYSNQEIIEPFIQQYRVPVTTIVYDWDVIWKELINIGIYKTGADLSETGSTWVPSLASMNVLRPFSSSDVSRLGGSGIFVPAAWQSAMAAGDSQVWAIPFSCDVRLIYYWRDMFNCF